LQQVIWNLLSNALKFTPKAGTVTVRVTHEGSVVRLTVQDTGKGIDPQFLPHIFEPFRQGDSSTTRAQGGIGLGLTIVRTLVELHGGDVRAESEGPNRGAVFAVEFPVLELPPAITSQNEPSSGLSQRPGSGGELPLLPGVTVLVVDDQDYTRDVAAAILRRAQATVLAAASVREGLKILAEQEPDLVLCDIAMPQEDGYDFVRAARERGGPLSTTPIVALTAYSRPQDRIRALNAGFDEYLKKPVDPLDLVETIKRLTTERR
jgi:CheY-like chemotaxis protein